MLEQTSEQFFKEIRELREIRNRVINGETVFCPNCGAQLIFCGLNSGKHPGIFCPNNDFKILMDYNDDIKD